MKPTFADQAQLRTLFERFRPALHRYFQRRRVPEKDIDDAVQEVFVRLSRRDGLASIAKMEGYLFETAASVAIDQVRRARTRHRDAHETYDDRLHALEDFSPDALLEGQESVALLVNALLELPERTRNVFVLSRLEHMRHADIARQLGISVSAVEKHALKAMVHLIKRVRGPA